MPSERKSGRKGLWARLAALPDALEGISKRLERIETRLQEAEYPARTTAMPPDAARLPPPGVSPGEIYAGYSEADMWIFDRFSHAAPEPAPGFVTDWLGTRTRCTSLWEWARENDGKVTPLPVPHDLYEAVEWIGTLKSVIAAPGPRFTMMELGAGFGPWLGAGAQAARLLGLKEIFLLGVEADPGRYEMMRQHLVDNSLDPEEHDLVCGAVGVEAGQARWPHIGNPADATGARPVTESEAGIDAADMAYMQNTVQEHYIDVTIFPFTELLRRQAFWDLVHIDVQGWETKICRAGLEELNSRARWLNIGTHSRAIDGELIELFHEAGWVLEHEKPTRFTYRPEQASIDLMTEVDGCQVWRNPKLASPLQAQ